MGNVVADEALDMLFRNGRTHSVWLDKPVTDELRGQVYELMKWGPTSANGSPARIVFARTKEGKEDCGLPDLRSDVWF